MSNAALEALASLGLPGVEIPANEAPAAEAAPVIDTAAAEALVAEQATADAAEIAEQAALGVNDAVLDQVSDAPAKAAPAPVSGPAFSVGATELFTVAELPSNKRTVAPKAPAYDLSDIPAPSAAGFGGKLIRFEGGDEKKFARSVRSCVTNANRQTREAGQPGPFYTSQNHVVDGKFVGMAVYRTDVDPSPKTNDAE